MKYHDLLPKLAQDKLRMAAETKRLDMVDRAIDEVMMAYPARYHTKDTLEERVFVNQPAEMKTPMAGYIIPLTPSIYRR